MAEVFSDYISKKLIQNSYFIDYAGRFLIKTPWAFLGNQWNEMIYLDAYSATGIRQV